VHLPDKRTREIELGRLRREASDAGLAILAGMSTPSANDSARDLAVAAAIELFAENGYEATSVDQIAQAAKVSRRTFFRQFRSKEDVIFSDHEALLAQVRQSLEQAPPDDPRKAVCEAAELVFAHFQSNRPLSLRRYRVVQQVPALRDRELVTTYRYERLFTDYLRAHLSDEKPVRIVEFAAAVTAAHNYLLRGMIRGDLGATSAALRAALDEIRLRFARTL
jgi:AcrR family transcriptional regulator